MAAAGFALVADAAAAVALPAACATSVLFLIEMGQSADAMQAMLGMLGMLVCWSVVAALGSLFADRMPAAAAQAVDAVATVAADAAWTSTTCICCIYVIIVRTAAISTFFASAALLAIALRFVARRWTAADADADADALTDTGAGPHGRPYGHRSVHFCIYDTQCRRVELAALAAPVAPIDCSARSFYTAMVSASGVVYSSPDDHLAELDLPWPAAAVRSADDHTVAVARGGAAVCCWGKMLGDDAACSPPTEVQGLPEGDPVVLFDAGDQFVVVVTRSDEVYGWGRFHWDAVAGGGSSVLLTPERIAALSGLGLRRLACGGRFPCGVVAETRDGRLLWWGMDVKVLRQPPQPLPSRTGRVVFPLRCLAASLDAAAVADAAGRVRILWHGTAELLSAGLPPAERFVRVAVADGIVDTVVDCVVALTAEGCLWDCRKGSPSRSITAANPSLPRGLLPCGGQYYKIVLFPDSAQRCTAVLRCRLLLLAAGRRDLLPGGQMPGDALVPFLVDEGWVFKAPPSGRRGHGGRGGGAGGRREGGRGGGGGRADTGRRGGGVGRARAARGGVRNARQ
eukprot:TRINITY_DN13144_c0_g1_i1.p1 TRINITY_DN13144_c0_g1~~TRINITY_DN13144_c0_g1_i1.p1  ORF type:complete len:570 (+),score=67.72 TRINITY_DN13144_c0_g1_i1:70-1779(+)